MPDNTLKQPVPTPTAEELAARILDIGEGALVDLTKGKTLREALNIAEKSHLDALKKSADLIASALAQAKAKERERCVGVLEKVLAEAKDDFLSLDVAIDAIRALGGKE